MKRLPVFTTGEIVRSTDRAFLATVCGKTVWLPKSRVEAQPKLEGDLHSFTIPHWLAKEKRLI